MSFVHAANRLFNAKLSVTARNWYELIWNSRSGSNELTRAIESRNVSRYSNKNSTAVSLKTSTRAAHDALSEATSVSLNFLTRLRMHQREMRKKTSHACPLITHENEARASNVLDIVFHAGLTFRQRSSLSIHSPRRCKHSKRLSCLTRKKKTTIRKQIFSRRVRKIESARLLHTEKLCNANFPHVHGEKNYSRINFDFCNRPKEKRFFRARKYRKHFSCSAKNKAKKKVFLREKSSVFRVAFGRVTAEKKISREDKKKRGKIFTSGFFRGNLKKYFSGSEKNGEKSSDGDYSSPMCS